MGQATIYAETSSVRLVWTSNSSSNYITAHSATDATRMDSADFGVNNTVLPSLPSVTIMRSILVFDLSTIPSGSTIESAEIELYVTSGAGRSLARLKVQQHSSSPDFAVADYHRDNFSGDGGESGYLGGMTTFAYNSITLNATGIGWLSLGECVLAVRHSYEIDQDPPTDASELIYADGPSDAHPPRIVVTYSETHDASCAVSAVAQASVSPSMFWDASASLSAATSLYVVWSNIVSAEVAIQAAAQVTIAGVLADLLFHYAGTLSAGQILVIDCDQQLVTLDGVNDVKNMSGDWIELAVGDNEIDVTFNGTSIDVDVDYQERWA